jgi:hypothetical protein
VNSGRESPSDATTDGAGVTSDGGCRGPWSVLVVVVQVGLAWW